MQHAERKLLTTKELPAIAGLSESYFEKGRIYGYGPPFIKIRSGQRAGKILYRRSAIETWLEEQTCEPEQHSHVR